MKPNQKPSDRFSTKDLIQNSFLPNGNQVQQKGKLKSEAIMLMLKKLGISDKEIKEMNLRSVRENQKIAKEFEEDIAANAMDVDAIVLELMRRKLPQTVPPMIYDWPAPTGSWRFELTNPYRNFNFRIEGQGDGYWRSSIRETAVIDPFLWKFVAMDRGDYNINALVISAGPLFVIADSGPCNDKNAFLSLALSMMILKTAGTGAPAFGFRNHVIWSKVVEDTAIRDTVTDVVFLQPSVVSGPMPNSPTIFLEKNDEVTVQIDIQVNGWVQGAGSISSLDFSKGKGVVYCPHLDISWTGRP